jgi:N-acetylneuraminic acid mutarotase
MIIWGGQNNAGTAYYGDGARYDLASDTWTPIGAPPSGFSGRSDQGCAWTGSKMVVWGGTNASGSVTDGASYDLGTDTWKTIATSPLSARFPEAAYASTTGDVLFWGSKSLDKTLNDGAAYTPVTDRWTAMSASPLVARGLPAFQWTGTQLIVWGGIASTTTLSDGARYNPVSGSWTKLGDPPLGFTSRVFFGQSTIKGGLIFVGGISPAGPSYLADGLYFDATGTASAVPAIPSSVLATPARDIQQAWSDGTDRCWFWSGGQLDFFTGSSASVLAGGAMYTLSTNTWSSMTSVGEPSARGFAQVVWTGKSAIVWGGASSTTEFADGAIFTP